MTGSCVAYNPKRGTERGKRFPKPLFSIPFADRKAERERERGKGKSGDGGGSGVRRARGGWSWNKLLIIS